MWWMTSFAPNTNQCLYVLPSFYWLFSLGNHLVSCMTDLHSHQKNVMVSSSEGKMNTKRSLESGSPCQMPFAQGADHFGVGHCFQPIAINSWEETVHITGQLVKLTILSHIIKESLIFSYNQLQYFFVQNSVEQCISNRMKDKNTGRNFKKHHCVTSKRPQ